MSSHSSPLKYNQSNYSSPSKANDNIRHSPNKSTKFSKKLSEVPSPIAAQSVIDAQSLRSQRSIVETVEEKVDPKLIEEKNKNKLNRIINESPINEKEANTPTLFYVEIGPTLSISSLYNLSHRLIVLRLTGTELPKPKIPYVESLRTLFLDQCKLKSLVGFPLYPKLRYLNLSRNSLDTFKGLPVCPDLEEFDIRDNKVDFDADLALAAIASVSMCIYNGKKIKEEQIKQAFTRSPLIGYSLRQGFPAFSNDKNVKSTKSKAKKNNDNNDESISNNANNYLIKQLLSKISTEENAPTTLLINNESATVTLPIKGANIKWYLNTQPSAKQPSEWEQVPNDIEKKKKKDDTKSIVKQKQILNITQMMYQHLIRCEFSLPNDTTNQRYSMYTLNVIGSEINKDKNELILPFPINPQVTGEPYEGSLVSLVPMPVPCHVSWYVEDNLIIKNVNSIRLSEKYIDHEVSCLLQPYCKSMPEITFTHLLAKTNPVERLNPIVTNVYFPDDVIEGVKIEFNALVLPKREAEGNSEIVIERAISPSGNWEAIKVLQPFRTVYTPTLDDVGCFLRCKYLPVLNDGTRPIDNKPTYFYSKSRVIPGFPAFTNPMIVGDTRTGHSVVAIGNYFGGRKGQCQYKWFKSTQKIKINSNNDSNRRSLSLSKISSCTIIEDETKAILNLTKSLVGLYLAVEMVPIRNDDTVGEKVIACLDHPITQGGTLTPLKRVPSNNQIVAYKLIDLKTSVVWYRTNPDWRDSHGNATGFEKILTGPEYTPTDRDVGQFLRLMTSKGESDMIIGEVRPSVPFIYNFDLKIRGRKCEVGSFAEVPKKTISIIAHDDDDDNDYDYDNQNENDSDNDDFESRSTTSKRHDNTYLKGVPKTALDEYFEDISRRRKVEIVWVRMTKNNIEDTDYIEKVVEIDTTKYTFTKSDVNSRIKAVIYPLDDEGNRYPPTHSTPTKLIKDIAFKQPIMKGELKVGGFLTIDFNDFPIYSLTWERTKKMKWEPICTFTFDHFETNETGEDVPCYKLDIDEDNNVYTNLRYAVQKEDIDYHIQAQIEPGEIREMPDPKNPKNTILTMVQSELIHGKLKSSLETNKTDKDKTKSFVIERVAPKDLQISINEDIKNEPITEGRKINVDIDGADSKGKKPEIVWQYKTIVVRESKETKGETEEFEKWKVKYKGNSHTFTNSDVGKEFRVFCTNTEEYIKLGTIQPSMPTVSDFTIKQDNNGSVVILNAKYHGGIEGKSVYYYSVSSNVGNTASTTTTTYSYNEEDLSYIDNSTLNVNKLKKVVKIDENNSNSDVVRMFTPIKDMFNKRVDIGLIPVRSDGTKGRVHWSNNSIVVKSIPIIDAVIKYPNDDIDHLQVGAPLTCVITRCSMKNCSYKFTWKRYTPINNNANNSEDGFIADEEENSFKKEVIKSNSTINNSSSYKLRQADHGCFIICQIVAVAENGFLSPIFNLESYQIILPNMKEYTLSINIPLRKGIRDVKATKRYSGSLAKSEKLDGEVDTGDTLEPILNPTPKRNYSIQYEWQILSDTNNSNKTPSSPSKKTNNKLSFRKNSSSSNLYDDSNNEENIDDENINNDDVVDENDNENKWTTVSMEDKYTCSVLDFGCMIRCICTIEGNNYSDMIESIPIGPVRINPKIEAPARAIIRADSFKIRSKAPSGKGQWDFLINSKGITITKKNSSVSRTTTTSSNEQFVKWSSVSCNLLPDDLNQIEITTGPAMRIIIVPELIDERLIKIIPKNGVRDFCIFIINQFKKKNMENNAGK